MATLVEAGKITIPGNTFSVTGLPFAPTSAIFIWTDASAEDSWTVGSTGIINVGMGMASSRNSVSDASIVNTCVYEINQSNDLASTQSFTHCVGTRATRNFSVGYRFLVTSFNSDGFTMGVPSGITNAGHVGKFIYYMAFGNTPSAMRWADMDHQTVSPVWEPQGWVEVGSANYTEDFETGIQWADICHTQFAAGHWHDPTTFNSSITMAHGSSQNDGARPPQWLEQLDPAGPPILDPPEDYAGSTSFMYASSEVGVALGTNLLPYDTFHDKKLSDNSVTWTAVTSGEGIFGDEIYGLRAVHLLLQGGFQCGSFVPSTTIGETVSLDLDLLNVKGVMFFAGGHDPEGIPLNRAQTSFGFVTEDFQCTVVGAFQFNGAGARFSSSSAAWVSNTVGTLGNPIGTNRMLGTAALTPTGFEYTTTEDNSDDFPHHVYYWAIGEILYVADPPFIAVSCLTPSSNFVYIEWAEPDDNGFPITGYNIYRGTEVGAEILWASVGPDVHAFIDESAGIVYYYYVTAVNDVGESIPSNTFGLACVTPGDLSFHHDHKFALEGGE